jgi:hypothetical protein
VDMRLCERAMQSGGGKGVVQEGRGTKETERYRQQERSSESGGLGEQAIPAPDGLLICCEVGLSLYLSVSLPPSIYLSLPAFLPVSLSYVGVSPLIVIAPTFLSHLSPFTLLPLLHLCSCVPFLVCFSVCIFVCVCVGGALPALSSSPHFAAARLHF